MISDDARFEEIKAKIFNMNIHEHIRLINEVIPMVWERACHDASCVAKVKKLLDSHIVRPYEQMHMGGI